MAAKHLLDCGHVHYCSSRLPHSHGLHFCAECYAWRRLKDTSSDESEAVA